MQHLYILQHPPKRNAYARPALRHSARSVLLQEHVVVPRSYAVLEAVPGRTEEYINVTCVDGNADDGSVLGRMEVHDCRGEEGYPYDGFGVAMRQINLVGAQLYLYQFRRRSSACRARTGLTCGVMPLPGSYKFKMV